MSTFGRSSLRSPDLDEVQNAQASDDQSTVTITIQPRFSQCVWTNVNITKGLVKVKTYVDLLPLVLSQ
jgi:hypothetical protein